MNKLFMLMIYTFVLTKCVIAQIGLDEKLLEIYAKSDVVYLETAKETKFYKKGNVKGFGADAEADEELRKNLIVNLLNFVVINRNDELRVHTFFVKNGFIEDNTFGDKKLKLKSFENLLLVDEILDPLKKNTRVKIFFTLLSNINAQSKVNKINEPYKILMFDINGKSIDWRAKDLALKKNGVAYISISPNHSKIEFKEFLIKDVTLNLLEEIQRHEK